MCTRGLRTPTVVGVVARMTLLVRTLLVTTVLRPLNVLTIWLLLDRYNNTI